MKIFLAGFHDPKPFGSSRFLGRYSYINNVRRLLENNPCYTVQKEWDPKSPPDLFLCADVTCATEALRSAHAIYGDAASVIPAPRILVHSVDHPMFWENLYVVATLCHCSPNTPGFPVLVVGSPRLVPVLRRYCPAAVRVILAEGPVFPKSLPLPGVSHQEVGPEVFFGRIDGDTKFDIEALLIHPSVSSALGDHPCGAVVCGSVGSRDYLRLCLLRHPPQHPQWGTPADVSFQPDVSDATLHAYLSKAQRIWCLADRPQESYGIAPREALMYPRELVVTDHAAFVPPDHEAMGVTVIPVPPLAAGGDPVPCLDTMAELASDILRRSPIQITEGHMDARMAYLESIKSEFVPKLCAEPKILLLGDPRELLSRLDGAWIRNVLAQPTDISG